MQNSQGNSDEIFKSISKPEIATGFPNDIASDALSVVVDAINSTVGGMIITDREGYIRFANPSFCRMFDYVRSEITGRNSADLFSTKEVRKLSDVIAIIDISSSDTEEFVVEKRDGTTFIVEVSASNVTNVAGIVVGRMASFVDITKRKEIETDREKLIKKLREALDRIKTLKGIIPICASCKKIRDDKGYWNQIETYIKEHSDADFSHSICPDCIKRLYPDIYESMEINSPVHTNGDSARSHPSNGTT